MITRALFPSVLLSCGLPAVAAAQSGHLWKPDPNAVQFAWVSANVVVTATDSDGVAIWAFTSRGARREHNHTYTELFDPDSMLAWLNQAHSVATREARPASGEPATDMHTASLSGRGGGRLTLVRTGEKHGWSDRAEFVFHDSTGGTAWSIGATRRQADSLIMTLFTQASRSRLVARPLAPIPDSPDRPGDRLPVLIRVGPALRPPADLGREELYVKMRFVIGTDGRPEADSFVAEFYDDPRLADIAYKMFMDTRYEPGLLGGTPVRVTVQQGIVFNKR